MLKGVGLVVAAFAFLVGVGFAWDSVTVTTPILALAFTGFVVFGGVLGWAVAKPGGVIQRRGAQLSALLIPVLGTPIYLTFGRWWTALWVMIAIAVPMCVGALLGRLARGEHGEAGPEPVAGSVGR